MLANSYHHAIHIFLQSSNFHSLHVVEDSEEQYHTQTAYENIANCGIGVSLHHGLAFLSQPSTEIVS